MWYPEGSLGKEGFRVLKKLGNPFSRFFLCRRFFVVSRLSGAVTPAFAGLGSWLRIREGVSGPEVSGWGIGLWLAALGRSVTC